LIVITEENHPDTLPRLGKGLSYTKQDCKHCLMQYKKSGYPLLQKCAGATGGQETKENNFE
jgi:hypothetical protein